jgi:hypothetical protein
MAEADAASRDAMDTPRTSMKAAGPYRGGGLPLTRLPQQWLRDTQTPGTCGANPGVCVFSDSQSHLQSPDSLACTPH